MHKRHGKGISSHFDALVIILLAHTLKELNTDKR